MEKNGFAVPRADTTRRKYVPPTFPTLYFRDSILSMPGYVFEKVCASPCCLFNRDSHLTKGNTMGGYGKLDAAG
jgi:hypothetical protein